MSYLIGQRKNPVPYPVGTIAAYFALALALFAVTRLVQPEALWARLVVNTAVLLLYVAAALYGERRMVAQAASQIVNRIKKHRK